MRNLTIKRAKSFVGCLAKMKIYIEDPIASELTINQVPCRKLGELKNGEEKTFAVGEQSARVFVIADTLSKDYCNEYYILPEGGEDLFLTGKNRYNPTAGNPFRFDNNDHEEVISNRKRGKRIGLVVWIVAVIVGAVVGWFVGTGMVSSKAPEAKTFDSKGLKITLTDEFEEIELENYTVTYDSSKIAVFALKEPFTLAEGLADYTLQEYAELVVQNNGLSLDSLEKDGQRYFFAYEFTNPETQDIFCYYSYVYKTGDAFWMVQFVTLKEHAQTYAQQFDQWADTVEFS